MKKIILLLALLFLAGCSSTSIYFCPRDDCQGVLLKELDSAEDSIYFMVYSFTDEKISDMLIDKFRSGIDVKGVMEYRQKSRYSQYNKLRDSDVDVNWDRNRASMHHKVFIIDGRTVTTGSYNPTANGNERNNENFLVIHDKSIAKKYVKEFNRIT